jgi:hypothetical protein
MILIREHIDDSLERTGRVCEPARQGQGHAQNVGIIDIDESDLAWFYIAPGCGDTGSCRRLLTLARDLIGPNAWAVIQADDAGCQTLCRELGLRVVASYLNEADGSSGVSVHIVQTTQPGAHP